MVLLVFAAVGIAAGVHLASTAVVMLAAGHLAVAGILFAVRAVGNRRAEVSR